MLFLASSVHHNAQLSNMSKMFTKTQEEKTFSSIGCNCRFSFLLLLRLAVSVSTRWIKTVTSNANHIGWRMVNTKLHIKEMPWVDWRLCDTINIQIFRAIPKWQIDIPRNVNVIFKCFALPLPLSRSTKTNERSSLISCKMRSTRKSVSPSTFLRIPFQLTNDATFSLHEWIDGQFSGELNGMMISFAFYLADVMVLLFLSDIFEIIISAFWTSFRRWHSWVGLTLSQEKIAQLFDIPMVFQRFC